MRISDWSSDVCSSDLPGLLDHRAVDQREDVLPEPEAQAHDALPDVEQRRARRGIVRVREVLRQLLEADADRRGEAAQEGVAEIGRILDRAVRSEEHTSELQSLMRISYAVFCLKKKNEITQQIAYQHTHATQLCSL